MSDDVVAGHGLVSGPDPAWPRWRRFAYHGENSFIVLALAAMMVIGGAWGGIWVCNNIIRADLVSQNLANTEKHTEALYYGLLNVIQNMGGILQSAAMMLASIFFGFVSGEDPGPRSDLAFRFLMGWAPLVVPLISWLFARSFLKDYPEKVLV